MTHAVHTLVGVGVGPGAPDLVPEPASALLASADVVFVPVADHQTGTAERAVLFYAEAWRVERVVVRPGGWAEAAVQIAVWLAARPGSVAVVATLGARDVAPGFTALADSVRGLLGDLDVRHEPGPRLTLPAHGGAR